MSIAPGTIEHWMHNEHYRTEEDFLFAIADAMHEEYKAITDAGLSCRSTTRTWRTAGRCYPEMTSPSTSAYADVRVEAMNRALRGIPGAGPPAHLLGQLPHAAHARHAVGRHHRPRSQGQRRRATRSRQRNPRHEHEWAVFKDFKLPEGKSSSRASSATSPNMVEHPELVAQRLVRYANLVGRENVIAGTDCGIGSRVAHGESRLGQARGDGRRRAHRVEGALGEIARR